MFYVHPHAENSKGVTYFHPLPSSVTNFAAKSLTPLGLALVALKSAYDMLPKFRSYKGLVDSCVEVMWIVCSHIEADSFVLPTSDLQLLQEYAVNLMLSS